MKGLTKIEGFIVIKSDGSPLRDEASGYLKVFPTEIAGGWGKIPTVKVVPVEVAVKMSEADVIRMLLAEAEKR